MTFAAVIFDLDDTLLDSSALLSARDARRWEEVYSRLGEVAPFPVRDGETPVDRLPREIRRRGIPVGLYTHSPKPYANELLRAHRIEADEMVTGSDRFPAKPDPSGLLAVTRLLDVAAEECVYVGDSVGDFGAAAAARMRSVGVAWRREVPATWRRGWPDVVIDRPGRLLDLVDGQSGLGPIGEMVAEGTEPTPHWGSIIRLGGGTFALGRYYQMGDRRYPAHALSRLIIDAKDGADAQQRLAEVFAAVDALPMRNTPSLVAAVPPRPGDPDRFDAARAALAELWGARDGGGLLTMREVVDDYKHMPHDVRERVNEDRFEAGDVRGARAMLIDDVVTSGAQAAACRAALRRAGARGVSVLVAAVAQDPLPDPCPSCGEEYGGTIRTKRRRRDGREFLGCSRWPDCSWSRSLAARS